MSDITLHSKLASASVHTPRPQAHPRLGACGHAVGVWQKPFTELRVPLLTNLRKNPFERAREEHAIEL